MDDSYQPIPILAAKEIAAVFDKNQVIIVTWDEAFGMMHVTTYGRTKEESIQAAEGGNFIKAALGWPEDQQHDVPEWWIREREMLLEIAEGVVSAADTDFRCPFCSVIGDRVHTSTCLSVRASSAIRQVKSSQKL